VQLREANKEVGFSHFVTTLPPFLSTSQLLVTPVVTVLSPSVATPPFLIPGSRCSLIRNFRHAIKAFFTLNPHIPPYFTEVDRIFDHLLEAMLDPQLLLKSWELLSGEGEDWPYSAQEAQSCMSVFYSFPCARVSVCYGYSDRFAFLSSIFGALHSFCHFPCWSALTPQNATDVRFDALDGLIYSNHWGDWR
jgi:hypothetical protein